MKVYQEISLKNSPEIPLCFLWEKLFHQIHLALVSSKTVEYNSHGESECGLSFPNYDKKYDKEKKSLSPLGNTLRVFAKSEEKLKSINLSQRLNKLMDYCTCSNINPVPSSTRQVRFKRRQFPTNANYKRTIRRYVQKEQVSFEKARLHYSKFFNTKHEIPFIYVQSSSKHRFRLFIDMESVDQAKEGMFSCYGLSKDQATVPWF